MSHMAVDPMAVSCISLAVEEERAVYTKVVDGQVAFLIHADGSEKIAILPDKWETEVDLEALAETVIIADDCFMQEQAEENH